MLMTPVVRRWLEEGSRDPDAFWEQAARALPWFRTWDRVFEWTVPSDPVGAGDLVQPAFRWFAGAETNLAFNALDHHVARGRSGHTALIWLNERGERRLFTYASLLHEVERIAAALRALGLGRGDRLTIYMPTCPEAIALMLAAVRIGAIHSVVFAGFGARALGDRIIASGSRAVFTADATYRKGKRVELQAIVDEALQMPGHAVECLVRLDRDERSGTGQSVARGMSVPRQLTWTEFIAGGHGHSGEHIVVEANEPAFILATSGTTARPKLAVHTHGGYQVHIAAMGRWCFGLKADDVWWATSDIGWIVGHSYMVYAPLLAGCTTVAFEGALDHPAPESHWRAVVEEYGATGIFTSPTAVRMLMRYGEQTLASIDHRRLERVVCAGEVLNPQAWDWLQNRALRGRVPVIDHMWQTETGGPVFGNPYGIAMLPIKPGSATVPLPGIAAAVVRPDGERCAPGEKGIMVLTRPFPGMTPALWGEQERYGRDYWEKVRLKPDATSGKVPLKPDATSEKGRPEPDRTTAVYYSGDSAYVDEDGYFWFCGRADEVIKIAAHRLGTIEVESAFLMHPAVAECGVVGRPDETRGEVVAAFVLLKHGHDASDELRRELLQTIRHELGALAVVGEVNFVGMLPKTRSGKIMRRVLKAVVLNVDPGDITTIEDEGSVEEARQAWNQLKAGL
jgi:acetyl-CoA synthetase